MSLNGLDENVGFTSFGGGGFAKRLLVEVEGAQTLQNGALKLS